MAERGDRADWRTVLAARRAPRRIEADAGTGSRVVLLGTAGGSNPKATRCGYANAVVVGDAAYLVDCGEGAHRQLWRAGLTLNPAFGPERPRVRALFVTHLHADHVMDLGNLLLGSWPPPVLDVYGPVSAGLPIPVFPREAEAERPLVFPDAPTPGMRSTVDRLLSAYAYNINLRIADEGRSPVTESLRVHELDLGRGDIAGRDPGSVAPDMDPVVIRPEDDHGVTVSAVLVQHAPVFPAFGFRFDTPHGSVAFSGDTGPCANVVRLAQGADVLVHEVIDVDRMPQRLRRLPNYESVRNHLASAHSTPEQVGEIATRAGVRKLVLSHLVPGDLYPTEAEWEARVRPHFAGDVLCGVDLDELPLR